MMKIELLSPIMQAMASGTLPPPVADAVQRWNGLVQTATHVRSSSNHIFKFRRANQWLFLRLSPLQKRSKVQIEAELDFVRHVANVGVPVAKPLQSLRELFIEEVDWGEHLYYAVVFEGLHGRQWSDPNDLTLTLFKEWGSTLAKIHRASQTFASGSSPRRPSWKDSLREAREWLPAEDKFAHYELSVTSEWLMSMPIDAENYGLIHRDPELDNLIWDGRHFQVFDFDDCVYCWYVADIAAGLDGLWHNDKLAQTPWLSSFLEGYCAVLNTLEVREFDLRQFLRCIRIFDYAQVVNALQTTTDPAPPWLVAIKKRSENWLTAQRKLFATNAACAHNR